MINSHFYSAQLRSYLVQFCCIFAGLQVVTGKGVCDEPEFMSVPIKIGSSDRVVAALNSGNTQNKPFSLPMMSANMSGLQFHDERPGMGTTDRRTYLAEGGVFPDDLKTVVRVKPNKFLMTLDLSIYASNTDQLYQILEQILVLFNPAIQVQTTDSAFDWTKITQVELTGINNEENYPAGGDRRIIVWTLNFEMPIWISAPMDQRDEVVKKIIIRLGDLDGFQIDEVDQNGDMVPFLPGFSYGTIEVDGN